MKRSIITICILFFAGLTESNAQLGGKATYGFLNLTSSARTAALGGNQISVKDNDPALTFHNPALVDSSMHNHASISFVPYLADIIYGYATYARQIDKFGMVYGGFQYVDYGTFTEADEFGNITGTFHAGDYSLQFGHARNFYGFDVGAAVKFIYSQYDEYNSVGLAFDLGTFYKLDETGWGFGLTARNLGFQILSYTREETEPLPLDIQLGISKRLLEAPFRFSLLAHSLQHPDLTFKNPNRRLQRDLETGEFVEEEIPFTEKVARHLTFGVEVLFSDNFQLRGGYNHQRRKEMANPDMPGIVGFSFGGMLRINRFHINYAYVPFHAAGASNHFTITTNFSSFMRKDRD